MDKQQVITYIKEGLTYDLQYSKFKGNLTGWKISIQGKTIEDAIFLYDRLSDYLISIGIPFKVATVKRFSHEHKEQSKKAMTIYHTTVIDFNQLCEEVYSRTINYKGWYDINTPTSYEHYAGGLYVRNDRDEYGNYIAAN